MSLYRRPAAGPQGQGPHHLPALIDGRGDDGSQAVHGHVRDAPWIGAIFLDHDQPPFGDRVAGDPDVHSRAPDPVENLRRVSDGGDDLDHGWLLGVDQAQINEFVAKQLAGPVDDRHEDFLQVGPTGDRPLQRGQALEQGLTLA
jgi:hypothetical protein